MKCTRCQKPTTNTCIICTNPLCPECARDAPQCDSCQGQIGDQSEVARLRKQIQEEYEAAQRGMYGPAQGVSKHEFITRKMENMDKARQELEKLVGKDEAARIVSEQMDKSDQKKPKKPEGDQP